MTVFHRLGFVLPVAMPILLVVSHQFGFWYAIPMFVFVLVPILDHFLGDYLTNPSPRELDELQSTSFFNAILFLYVPLQFGLLIWACLTSVGLTWPSLLVLALSVGIVTGGIGITVAHELGHRRA
ncbi:MAG: hypothetical protein AAF438_14080, partial [Pseudomonadota bacterium]